MPLDKFNYNELSAFNATQELITFGDKLLDGALDNIKTLQGKKKYIALQLKSEIDFQDYFIAIERIQTHYKEMHLIPTRTEARSKFFSQGRIFKLATTLKAFIQDHAIVLTTGTFTLNDCLMALAKTQQIKKLLDDKKITDFSTTTDEVFLFIKQLNKNIDNLDELFPNLDFQTDFKEFAQNYYERIAEYLLEIRKALILATIHCIDENLKDSDVFLNISDCLTLASLNKKIPNTMRLEKMALSSLAEYHKHDKDEIAVFYQNLLQEFERVKSFHASLDSIIDSSKSKIKRIQYYQQALEKACYFSSGMCEGAAKVLIDQDLKISRKAGQLPRKTKFHDLHNVSVSASIYNHHNTQHHFTPGFPQFLDSFEEISKIQNFDPDDFGDLATFREFVEKILEDVDRYSEDMFSNGMNKGPSVIVALTSSTNRIGHALAIQKIKDASGHFFYRFIDYNSGNFILYVNDEKDEILDWLAQYFSIMEYEEFHRYQLTIKHCQEPTKQTLNDFELRSNLRALFFEFDEAFCREDYSEVLKRILITYEAIDKKHIYDHYSIWTRVNTYLSLNFDIASAEVYRDAVRFSLISFNLLDRCNEHAVFHPAYKAHQFSALIDALTLVLRAKDGYKLSRYYLQKIIELLSCKNVAEAETNYLQEMEGYADLTSLSDFINLKMQALTYFKSIADFESLRSANNFKDAHKLIYDLRELFYSKDCNIEFILAKEELQSSKQKEIPSNIEPTFYLPPVFYEHAFYYTESFEVYNPISSHQDKICVHKNDKAAPMYMTPILHLFYSHPRRYLETNEYIVSRSKGAFTLCDSSINANEAAKNNQRTINLKLLQG